MAPKHQPAQHKKSRKSRQPDPFGGLMPLYGFHTVEAALKNPQRRIERLFVTENAANRLAEAIAARAITPLKLSAEDISRKLPGDAVHQGALALAEPLPEPSLTDIAPASPLLVLDQVTDPHNIGAVLRSAAAFAAAGVIVPAHGAPQPSGVLAKAASGGLEHVPYIQVSNLARALDQLKKDGYWVVGLEGGAETGIEDAPSGDRLVLVLGAEGHGLRRLTREHCDMLASIPLPGPLTSLNVSNAAAIALYAVSGRNRAR